MFNSLNNIERIMRVIFRKMKTAAFLGLAVLLVSQYSCTGCFCSKASGCKILTATSNTGSIVAKQIYCSQNDYYLDMALHDSVTAFKTRNQGTAITITEKDSFFKTESVQKVKGGDVQTFEAKGYACGCPK
jgi:hypothetical protein